MSSVDSGRKFPINVLLEIFEVFMGISDFSFENLFNVQKPKDQLKKGNKTKVKMDNIKMSSIQMKMWIKSISLQTKW